MIFIDVLKAVNIGFFRKDGNFSIKKALISLLQSALASRKCIWGCPQAKLIDCFLLSLVFRLGTLPNAFSDSQGVLRQLKLLFSYILIT